VLNNVAGVKYGTQVVYEGYPIGQVESIKPQATDQGMQFKLELAVRKDWRIPEHSTAVISSPGVLAARTILIRGGGSRTYLEPGDTLPSAGTADMFGALDDIAHTLSNLATEGLFPLINNLNEQITSAGELMRGDLKPLMDDLRAASSELQTRTPGILDNIESFSRELAAAGEGMDRALSRDNLEKVDRILVNAERASQQLSQMSGDIRKLVSGIEPDINAAGEDLRFTLETVARHIDSLSHNLDATSLQLLEFSREIRNNPSVIIRGTEPADSEETRRLQ
jgi:phospholipid/cholesterol/gamma-HCH transport system substrate-binding protein